MILFISLIFILLLSYCIGTKMKDNYSNYGNEWDSVKHNLNVINKKDYEEWNPRIELENIDGSILNEESVFKYYLDINYLYRKGFDYYLNSIINLENYDNILGDYIEKGSDSKYKKYSELNLEYIYVRSFPVIERLSNSDIQILLDRVIDNNYEIDNVILNVIDNTYSKCYVFAVPETEKWKNWSNKMAITDSSSENSIGHRNEVEKDAIWISIHGNLKNDSPEFERVKDQLKFELENTLDCKFDIVF